MKYKVAQNKLMDALFNVILKIMNNFRVKIAYKNHFYKKNFRKKHPSVYLRHPVQQ